MLFEWDNKIRFSFCAIGLHLLLYSSEYYLLIKLKMFVTRRDKSIQHEWLHRSLSLTLSLSFLLLSCVRILFVCLQNRTHMHTYRAHPYEWDTESERVNEESLPFTNFHSYRYLGKHITALNNAHRLWRINNKFHFRVAYFCRSERTNWTGGAARMSRAVVVCVAVTIIAVDCPITWCDNNSSTRRCHKGMPLLL